MTGIGINDNSETITVLAHIMQKNRMKNLTACFLALPSFLKITRLLIIKLIAPDTILASSVASATFHTKLDGRRYAKTVNSVRSISVQPIDDVANLSGVL